MTDRGAIMHCHDAKRDANDFDRLMDELNSIKRDKQVIQDMELWLKNATSDWRWTKEYGNTCPDCLTKMK